MLSQTTSLLLSYITGTFVFAPSLHASISLLNLVSCIAHDAADRERRRVDAARAAAASAAGGSNQLLRAHNSNNSNNNQVSVARSARLSPLQVAIVVATVVSILADLVIAYTCTRSLIDSNFVNFPKWMSAFNALKRIHSIVAIHIIFLRFQIVTGRFTPRHVGRSGYRAIFQRITANPPALVSTGLYSLVGFSAFGFQLYAFIANDWVGSRTWGSQPFEVYRILTFAGTCYLTLIGLVTDYSLIALSARLYDGSSSSSSRPPSFGNTPDEPTTAVSPLDRVKKYYNYRINVAYEVVVFLAYIACSVTYFWNPFFNPSVFLEQVLLSFIAWNGYALLHAALKEKDEGESTGGGKSGEGRRGASSESGVGSVEAWGKEARGGGGEQGWPAGNMQQQQQRGYSTQVYPPLASPQGYAAQAVAGGGGYSPRSQLQAGMYSHQQQQQQQQLYPPQTGLSGYSQPAPDRAYY